MIAWGVVFCLSAVGIVRAAEPATFVVLAPHAALYATAEGVEPFAVLPEGPMLHATWLGEQGSRARIGTVDWSRGHCTSPLAATSVELELYVEVAGLVPVSGSPVSWARGGRSVVLRSGVPVLDGVAVLPEGLRIALPVDPAALVLRYARGPTDDLPTRALADLVLPAGTVLDLGGATLSAPTRVAITGSRLGGMLTTSCAEIVAPVAHLEAQEPAGSSTSGALLVGQEPPPRVPSGAPVFDQAGHRIGRVSWLLRQELAPDGAGRQCGPIRLGWDQRVLPVVCVAE